jgi:predicted nucleotide-binding protein
MARKTNTLSPPPPELVVSREDAEAKIQNRIAKGKELFNRQINAWDQLEAARKDYYTWSEYNKELLKRLFTNDSLAKEYEGGAFGVFGGTSTLPEEIQDLKRDVSSKVRRLESIKERLELIPAPRSGGETLAHVPRPLGKKVFIVHGHDEGARESVARFLERLGIAPVILHEQANSGLTILEKLERNSDVDFAVILLTPDDVGTKAAAKDTLQPRARQNVILELGFFVAKLGRSRVCALHKGAVELPSDFLGIVYVTFDEASAWRVLLARELREAGFDVDLNATL